MNRYKLFTIGQYSFLLSTLIFFLIPLHLISQNYNDFIRFSPIDYLIYGLSFTLICSFIIFIFFWGISAFSFNISKKLLTFLLGYLIICGFYLSIRSGVIDGRGELQISYLNFFLSILISFIGTVFFENKFRLLLGLVLISGVITTFVNLITFPNFDKMSSSNEKFYEVSSVEKNIFLISFDALQSDNVFYILENNESYKKEFEDFILFKNVTSVAPFTILSIITTKLGYLPELNINTSELIKDYSTDFMTQTLKNANYQVSTYGSFGIGETPEINQVSGFKIAPIHTNVYITALQTSFQKYLPFRYNMNRKFKFLDILDNTSFPLKQHTDIYTLTKQDTHALSHYKTDIIHFDYFIQGLTRASNTQPTAHFHHYLFTHDPVTFDSQCQYQPSNSISQNKSASLQETECGIRKFITFIKKLKEINAFNNSLIIFASDHGYECEYNDLHSERTHKLSQRWCKSRYMPLLMVKPFDKIHQPLAQNILQVSLIDISKTICEAALLDDSICRKYEGINMLNVQPDYNLIKRNILINPDTVNAHTREYNNFKIININRINSITQY